MQYQIILTNKISGYTDVLKREGEFITFRSELAATQIAQQIATRHAATYTAGIMVVMAPQ